MRSCEVCRSGAQKSFHFRCRKVMILDNALGQLARRGGNDADELALNFSEDDCNVWCSRLPFLSSAHLRTCQRIPRTRTHTFVPSGATTNGSRILGAGARAFKGIMAWGAEPCPAARVEDSPTRR